MRASPGQLDLRDLRLFGAADLRPLLRDQGRRWHSRLHWDYDASIDLLLDYIEARSLPGLVALDRGHLVGYAFYVLEAAKAVIGDLYALPARASFEDAEIPYLPTCNVILAPLLETLQATPGIDRIETQMLLFQAGQLAAVFTPLHFTSRPRLYLLRNLHDPLPPATRLPENLFLQRWQPEFYDRVATLILDAYNGHMDADINDQYRTFAGAQRFLHNIVTFPGCGAFDPAHSWILRDLRGRLLGVALSSRLGITQQPSLIKRLGNSATESSAHITQLCLAPEARGRHLGRYLLEHTLRELRRAGFLEVSLTVTEANTPARQLYDALGFRTHQRFDAWVWQR